MKCGYEDWRRVTRLELKVQLLQDLIVELAIGCYHMVGQEFFGRMEKRLEEIDNDKD